MVPLDQRTYVRYKKSKLLQIGRDDDYMQLGKEEDIK